MLNPLRVAFFGQGGPYASPALVKLLDGVSKAANGRGAYEIVLAVDGRRKPMGRHSHRWHRPNTRRGELQILRSSESLVDVGLAAGIPVFQTCDVNGKAAIKNIASISFDVLVCVGFDRLFSSGILALPAMFALNAHPSELPKLRGPAPLFWALKAGLVQTAVTIHQIERGEDRGPIFKQAYFDLLPQMGGRELYTMAGRLAGELLGQTLLEILADSHNKRAQVHQEATRAPRPRAEDAFVNPTEWTCQHLINFACGAAYFRAPWLKLGNETFYIRRGLRAARGRVLPAHYLLLGSELVVQCSDGLAYLEIQR